MIGIVKKVKKEKVMGAITGALFYICGGDTKICREVGQK